MNIHNSQSQTSPESSIPEEGRSALDGSGPATEDEIRQLQQIEDFFRQYDCLPENYRPLSEDAPVHYKEKQEQLDDWAKSLAAELIAIPPSTFIGPLPESSEIMDRLTGFLRRYLACTSDQLTVLALWIMHTYSYKACSVTPYLNIHSMERRSGKTTCLQLLSYLCPDSWFVTAPAAVTVIRKLLYSRPIVLLDDRHITFSPSDRQQVVSLLTCGATHDQRYFAGDSGRTIKAFDVFCPKAFAGRGPFPPALADRSIPICLSPARPSTVKRIWFAEHEPDCELLIHLIRRWIADHCDHLFNSGNETSGDELPHLNPHQHQHVQPLLTLADTIGGDWPRQARLAFCRIFFEAQTDRINRSIQALYDVRQAFMERGHPERLSSHYLIEYLCGLNHRSWGEYKDGKAISGQALAQLLGRFQIEPNQQRMGSHGPVRGYDRQDFLATWAEHFDQPEETNCTDPTSGTGTSDGTAEVQ